MKIRGSRLADIGLLQVPGIFYVCLDSAATFPDPTDTRGLEKDNEDP
jgi:hypothetical protein